MEKVYEATILVEYKVKIKQFEEITQEDVENYCKSISDVYFDGSEDIETPEHLILSELENTISANLPTGVPYIKSDFLKTNFDFYVDEITIKEI